MPATNMRATTMRLSARPSRPARTSRLECRVESLVLNGGLTARLTPAWRPPTATRHLSVRGGWISSSAATTDGDGSDPAGERTDPAAFAIHIDDTGHISIAQYVSIEHNNTGSIDEDTFLPSGKISGGSDRHRLRRRRCQGHRRSRRRDRLQRRRPDIRSSSLSSATIIHDETPGVDGDANDVAPSGALDALFAAVDEQGQRSGCR